MATDIDEQSLRLSIELQAQDAAALIKGKARDDAQPPDIEFAAELYKYELQSLHMFYSDRALCRRLGGLGLEDGNALRGCANQAQPAPSKPKTTANERLASARSIKISTPATGASAGVAAKEATSKTTNETARERIEKVFEEASKGTTKVTAKVATEETIKETSKGTSKETNRETSKETVKQPNDKAAVLPSNNNLTSDTSTVVTVVEETTKSLATS